MPHATNVNGDDDYTVAEEESFQNALAAFTGHLPDQQADILAEGEPGEKAENAVDYADLSDDDLAEEDEADDYGEATPLRASQDAHSAWDNSSSFLQDEILQNPDFVSRADGDTIDDLFGDVLSSPVIQAAEANEDSLSDAYHDPSITKDTQAAAHTSQSPDEPIHAGSLAQEQNRMDVQQKAVRPPLSGIADAALSKEQRMQQALFEMSSSTLRKPDIPGPETQEQALKQLWPRFEQDTVPRFMDLLPRKRARYLGKARFRVPKPVHPTKLSLEIAMDQERSFKSASASNQKGQGDSGRAGLIHVQPVVTEEQRNDIIEDLDSDYEDDLTAGVNWRDLQMLCEDWDTHSSVYASSEDQDDATEDLTDQVQDDIWAGLANDTDEFGGDSHVAKKRKCGHSPSDILRAPLFKCPSLHDPEYSTSRIAQSVVLDLNDPRLLIDREWSHSTQQKESSVLTGGGMRRGFTTNLSRRYNISNDDAYDLLKENHQSKVRSTLGNMTVEHGMPAIKLQWPFYRTKMDKQQARSFHRPPISFQRNESATFSKSRIVKKKHLKGRDPRSIFACAKDLSLGDNSNLLLLEYSEEYPTMMSNFGMGSRLVNYYRRKDMDDTSRPKLDIGETTVLLPQDKSPFSIFGHIDPGETTPSLHNAMYRAPIFKQQPKETDFLVVRSRTGEDGSTYYMRNIENLHVVGQEFPSVDVPGPHSRKVTTASKNRLKMVSFRLLRNPVNKGKLAVERITRHFPGSTDLQNRQKMKEFLQFSKEDKCWKMRSGEPLPDEDAIHEMIKPEDLCLLESMEVGQQHLQDAGFGKGDDQDEDDDGREGGSIEQELAPWYTSRNFLNAAQGKAMLQLHGEGDPSGRGEAFSFIKTSMKGGFKAMGESVEERLDNKRLKEFGGHSYNVAKQQKSYEESIRHIWEAQKRSLQSSIDHSDAEMEDELDGETGEQPNGPKTPRSEAQTPFAFRHQDDETTSQFSKLSTGSQAGKTLTIVRQVVNHLGDIEEQTEIVSNPAVIRQYVKRRRALEAERTRLEDIRMTQDPDENRRNKQRLEEELIRLERNKERRIARDKQKGVHTDGAADSAGSPSSPAAVPSKPTGTQRKCANCGQVGHIKTNKKLCPLLNGEKKQDETLNDAVFTMGSP